LNSFIPWVCQCFAACVLVQSGEPERGVHQRRSPAGGATGKAQRHRHQPNEGADGGSQATAA